MPKVFIALDSRHGWACALWLGCADYLGYCVYFGDANVH
jgi:hypothetical protein